MEERDRAPTRKPPVGHAQPGLFDGEPAPPEETLDPADWGALRDLGHRMLDDLFDHLESIRERPVWRPVPEEAKQRLRIPLPRLPTAPERVYEEFKESILAYPTGNAHPRFFGWVMGTGTPIGMLADLLASGMNAHVAGYDQAAPIVETQVIEWIREIFGLPPGTSGLLVGGASVGNLIGLAVARRAACGPDLRRDGLQERASGRLVVYASSETHSWAQRAVELLGLGHRSLRRVPVDPNDAIDLDALRVTIADDRRRGWRPFCVIGNAGTVNTGAFDDLRTLATICRQEDLWFHVDGAFGAWARLGSLARDRVEGLEEADSLGVDLHKWPYLPFGVGCALVRDAEIHRDTFAIAPAYLASAARGILREPMRFADLGIDLTRSFRALKVWMSMRVHGVDTYARLIDQNVRQARHLAALVEAMPELELLAPVALHIVCFRFRRAGLDDADLDALNEEILCRLQESGEAVASGTRIRGRFALRAAINNHRTRSDDLDALVDAVVSTGRHLAGSGPSAKEAD